MMSMFFPYKKCRIYLGLGILFILSGCATAQKTHPPQQIRSDEEITQEVKEKLNERFPLGTPWNFIEVKTVQGDVYLSGMVEDALTKRAAEDIARNIPGVKDVINGIVVSPRP
jgi:osmotically-inducible protein OsmY